MRAGTAAKDSGIGVDALTKVAVYLPLVFLEGRSHWPFAGAHGSESDAESEALPVYFRDPDRDNLVKSTIPLGSKNSFWFQWRFNVHRKLFPFAGDRRATVNSVRGAIKKYALSSGGPWRHSHEFNVKGNRHHRIYEDLVRCAKHLDPDVLEGARIPLRSSEAAEPINPEYGGSAFLYCLCQRSDVNTFMETFLNVGGIAAIVAKSFSDREKQGHAPGHVYGFELYKNIWEASGCLDLIVAGGVVSFRFVLL